jgi:DNA-binding CsgD family transcriptional regulator
VLRAHVMFLRGQVGALAGELQAGIADIEASGVALARLSPADVVRVEELERQGVFASRTEIEGHLAGVLAAAGRVEEALARTQAIIDRAVGIPGRAWWGRAIALALAGRASEAREAYVIARDAAQRVSDGSSVVIMYLYQLSNVEMPYGTDNLVERSRIAREAEAAWHRVGGAHGDVSPRIAWLPILQIEGEWAAARALASSGIRPRATSERDLTSATVLAQLASAQGDVALAWELVHALLPSGSQTTPGHLDFAHALPLMRVAVTLCLDHDDLAVAQAWLDAHDRWLAWSGALLGQADGQNAWASYALAAGDLSRARHCVTRALALASEPRQPLALLTAHRLAGIVESHAGRVVEARHHLEAALALADACLSPYERALTRLAAADLGLRAGAIGQAEAALDDARSVFARLGAVPALARVGALATRLSDQSSVMQRIAPAGLSLREIEVLRLLASGRNNREIAETLFLSVRTVERHITNVYAKIGAQTRAEAIVFAHLHSLI